MKREDLHVGPDHPLREQTEAHLESIARELRGLFAATGGGQGARFRFASKGESTVLLYTVNAVELPKMHGLRAIEAGITADDLLGMHERAVARGEAGKVAPPPVSPDAAPAPGYFRRLWRAVKGGV